MKIALTIDDAPSISRESDNIEIDPTRMDVIRKTLKSYGVESCVAFVIGNQIEGNEERFERWLADGFELGNHTYTHLSASKTNIETFISDVKACDESLMKINAFNNKKWFRYPFLDRGLTDTTRLALNKEIMSLGYEVVPATIDFFDHVYERPLLNAIGKSQDFTASLIGTRYRETVTKSIEYVEKRLDKLWYTEPKHIAYCHFGPTTSQQLPNIIENLIGNGVEWCSVMEALSEPLYKKFNNDFRMNGLVSNNFNRTFKSKLKVKISRSKIVRNLFSQKELGLRWPYLS